MDVEISENTNPNIPPQTQTQTLNCSQDIHQTKTKNPLQNTYEPNSPKIIQWTPLSPKEPNEFKAN